MSIFTYISPLLFSTYVSSTKTSYVIRSSGSGVELGNPPSRLRLTEPCLVCMESIPEEVGSDGWKLHITRAVSACMRGGKFGRKGNASTFFAMYTMTDLKG